jgi:hypothetical protein
MLTKNLNLVNVYKLMGKFETFLENKEEMPSDAKEGMRELQLVINNTLWRTKKINGFGIDDIKFEIINQERANAGLQINLEGKGSAVVKNKDHLSRLLQRLVMDSRQELQSKNIFLEMMYHQIDLSDNVNENYNTPLGLKSKKYFSVVCAMLIFT